jgi:predicted DCC family thiol-disulfide oxidoreductase YuxK
MMLLQFAMDSDRKRSKNEPAGAAQTFRYPAASHPIVLYDGVCGLCNRTVQFVLKYDREGFLRFASLQSSLAAQILARHGKDASDLDTVYAVLNFDPATTDKNNGEELLERSSAVLYILRRLGGVWGTTGGMLRLIPRPIRDWGYGIVARIRYRVFGKYDMCPTPTAETRDRFLDL